MPAELDVDKEAVRCLTVAVGVREAARQMGLNENTVLAWANKGNWLQQVKEAQQRALLARTEREGPQSPTIKAADAYAATLLEGAKQTKLGLTTYAKRMAQQAAETGILEEAPLYKAVADIHSKMHPETQSDGGMQFNFFAINQEQPVERPVIDVEQA